jgi:CRP-like cAMP-binding protein
MFHVASNPIPISLYLSGKHSMEKTILEKLSEEMRSSTELHWETIALKRGEQVLGIGQKEEHIYQVQSGALRAIYMLEGEEQTIRFGYTGSMITGLQSLYTGAPSEIALEALRKSLVLRVSMKALTTFIEKENWRMRAYIELLQQLAVQQYEREIDLLTNNPKERLDRLLARSPQVFQEVPAKYIASYLRMTPETLSRLMA